jgi:hypothetical protein
MFWLLMHKVNVHFDDVFDRLGLKPLKTNKARLRELFFILLSYA